MTNELSVMMLPENWVHVPLPTHNNKRFAVYYNMETKDMTFTCPFDISQLQSMYRHFFVSHLVSC